MLISVKTIDLRPPAHSSLVDKKFNISSSGMTIVFEFIIKNSDKSN